MKKLICGICVLVIVLVASFARADIPRIARITNLSGKVQVQRSRTHNWNRAKLNMSLYVADKLRTASRSMAEIILDDGSLIRLREKSLLEIKDLSEDREKKTKKSIFGLPFGRLWSKVRKQKTAQSKFEVHTPTAVAGVRGTVLSVFVDRDLKTRVSVFAGTVEVKAFREEMKEEIGSVILNANQSTSFGAGEIPGIEPLNMKDRREWRKWDRDIKRPYVIEAAADKAMEQARHAITQNVKDADFQLGKSLIDVHGNRVRLEEYLLRPSPDQLQFLILNTRANRFDYGYSLYTFNKALPDNFSSVVRDAIKGSWDIQPDYWLTGNEAKFANHHGDYMNWVLSGGWATTTYEGWVQKFTQFVHMVNDKVKIKCDNLHDLALQAWQVPDAAGALYQVGENYDFNGGVMFNRDSEKATAAMRIDFEDGTWEQIEFYVIDDQGNLRTWDKTGTGADLENDNGEVRLTAKEFNGRDIDVVYSPKILIDANQSKW